MAAASKASVWERRAQILRDVFVGTKKGDGLDYGRFLRDVFARDDDLSAFLRPRALEFERSLGEGRTYRSYRRALTILEVARRRRSVCALFGRAP